MANTATQSADYMVLLGEVKSRIQEESSLLFTNL